MPLPDWCGCCARFRPRPWTLCRTAVDPARLGQEPILPMNRSATSKLEWRTWGGRTFSARELQLMRQTAADFGALGVTEIARTVRELVRGQAAKGKLKHHAGRELQERV